MYSTSHPNISYQMSVNRRFGQNIEHTKVRDWDNIQYTPYVISLFAFKAVSKLSSSP